MFDKLAEYCKNEPFHLLVVLILCVLTVVLALAILIATAKIEKAQIKADKKTPEKAEEKAPPAPMQAPQATEAPKEEPTEKTTPITEEEVTQKAATEEIQQIPAPAVSEISPDIKKEKASKPKTTKPKKAKADNDKEPTMLHDELKDINTDLDFYEEDALDRMARYSGKWVICRIVTQDKESDEIYFFELHASNGERLLSSEEYTTYNGALRGIETHKNNILRDNFRITLSKKGDYVFKLLNGKNVLLCMGEHYATKARCESAIESTKRFAKTAFIDENIQDHVVKVPVESNAPIQPLPDGYNGKWIIDCNIAPDGDKAYFFELFANNGERLLSSEEYTTYIGAVNGIHTHKMNIEKGNFRISLTKHGDYVYKLLNSNNQLLCLGEHYKTKRACQNAIESVKRFALHSPLLTNVDLTK